MSDGDWFRNIKWNDKIENHFFEKLARARSSRDQYLVIQALTLSETEPGVTLRLMELYFETRTDDFHDVQAHSATGDAYKNLGDLERAIVSYKRVLKREEDFPNHLTNTYVELPYLIATKSLDKHYDFATSQLSKGLREIALPVDEFMFHAANALIASEQRRMESASDHARNAIEAAGITKTGFRYHQSIGLVGNEHKSTIKRLRRITR